MVSKFATSKGITHVLSIVIIIVIVAVAFGGYFFGSANVSTNTTKIFQKSEVTETLVQVSQVTETNPMAVETITEVVLIYTGTNAGEGFCESDALNNTNCIGMSIVSVTTSTTMLYINPPNAAQGYVNVTVTEVTSYSSLSC